MLAAKRPSTRPAPTGRRANRANLRALRPANPRVVLAQLAAETVGGVPTDLRPAAQAMADPWQLGGVWLQPYLRLMSPVTRLRLMEAWRQATHRQAGARPDLQRLARRAVRLGQTERLSCAIQAIHHRDTALPLAFAAQFGASLGAAPLAAENALVGYGLALGQAEAITADIRALRLGPTCAVSDPIARALARLSVPAGLRLLDAIVTDDFDAVCGDLTVRHALGQSQQQAAWWAAQAVTHVSVLPHSRARQQLITLANGVADRAASESLKSACTSF